MLEIERKFLVIKEKWKPSTEGVFFKQGYLNSDPERTVRVRVAGEKAFLTVKGKTTGTVRLEFEYSIPVSEANEMLDMCHNPVIEKTRYDISYKGFLWEVDVFKRGNEGLIIAEIELEHEEQFFDKPDWVGEEVTYDKRYFNSYLSKNPFSGWK
jgi:adenylate cyclase